MMAPLVRPFWLTLAALALAWAWLLPNHVPPWSGFHSDAWAAIVLGLVAAYVLVKSPGEAEWHGVTLLAVAMIAVVVLQYATGLIHSLGVAWINMAYLLGLLVALLAGSAWERASRLQCADLLFGAAVVGAVLSVALQIHQWLHLEAFGPWILRSSGSRHYANMVQPNQLASLLLLGVLGCAWLNRRGWLHRYVAVFFAMCLLFGVALTESRTGWVNVALIGLALVAWRQLPGLGRLPSVGLGLVVFFAVCVLALPTLNQLLGASGIPVELRSMGDNARVKLWTTLIEAASLRPWFGFGWGQVGNAQFLMNVEQMFDGATLQNAHNLPLDLVLWMGIPLGVTVVALLAWWGWVAIRRVRDVFQVLMLLFLCVLVVHSMLEYPLQYAYFLLPAGLILGALNASLGFSVIFQTPKWTGSVSMLLAAAVLAVTVRDYLRVETSFYGLRFEQRKIQTDIPATPPDVLVLTQWADFITFSRVDPAQFHEAKDIAWASDLVETLPSALGMYKLAAMLAFADRPADAQRWQQVLCKVNDPVLCKNMSDRWLEASRTNPAMAAVPWVDNGRR
jgi:O-antigen ligase